MRGDALIRRIHAAPGAGVIVATGGGSRLIADLLAVPGASATVLEARVPYAAAALAEFVGAAPEQSVSVTTACDMAMVAFERARALAPDEPLPFGLAITASLRTRAKKRGEHRAHVAVQTTAATRVRSLTFVKSARTRRQEEAITRDLALGCLTAALDVDGAPELDLGDTESIVEAMHAAPAAWRALLLGTESTVTVGAPADGTRALLPGSFNPLHAGHRAMAQYAAERLGAPVAFELCIRNVDKPPLNYLAIAQRIRQFAPQETVILTQLPTFVAKARKYPNTTFLVGVDTVIRIAQAKYYGSETTRDQAFLDLAALGCDFLVFGRRMDGRFVSAMDLDLPHSLRRICTSVDEQEFRIDLSSTALRQAP